MRTMGRHMFPVFRSVLECLRFLSVLQPRWCSLTSASRNDAAASATVAAETSDVTV